MRYEMEEMIDLKEIKKTLTSWIKEEVSHGKECFDTKSCGETIDMIKDIAETMKECYEAEYYRTMIEAIGSNNESAYDYNHRHTMNGRFAKSGRGHMVSGYTPLTDQEPYIDAYMHDPDLKRNDKSEYGEIYDNYRTAKRHYQVSKSQADKEEMDQHCMSYMEHTLNHLKTMWDDADPMLKKKLKEDFGDEIIKVLEAM